MSRYYANHISSSFTTTDRPAGDDLLAAKKFAEDTFGDGFQEGELVIIDSQTVGYVTVASRSLPSGKWVDLI